MAAKTPDKIIRESIGSLTLLICQFSTTNIDDNDTYATGLGTNLIDCWFNTTLTDTAAKDVHPSISSGTVTFSTGEENINGTLYVLAKT